MLRNLDKQIFLKLLTIGQWPAQPSIRLKQQRTTLQKKYS